VHDEEWKGFHLGVSYTIIKRLSESMDLTHKYSDNTYGQLGLNAAQLSLLSPKAVPSHRDGAHPVRASGVSCGSRHTLIVLVDGTVLGCGSNALGELGVTGQRSETNRRFLVMDELRQVDDDAVGDEGIARLVVSGCDASVDSLQE
jgi:alpha-tubulin suppressor-like RCC1 family protein